MSKFLACAIEPHKTAFPGSTVAMFDLPGAKRYVDSFPLAVSMLT
jgi:hypothetical protein